MKKQVFFSVCFFFLIFSFAPFSHLLAQTDSLAKPAPDSLVRTEPKSRELTRPTRAALMSAALPGLGQYYNKKLWYLRIPIIYAGLGFFGYRVRQNHSQYIIWRDALLYKDDGNDLTRVDPRYAGYTSDRMQQVRDNYRRERDYNIIISIVFYALNIAEAATTAHLLDFDVSDNLAIRIEPAQIPLEQGMGQAFGLKLVVPLDKKYTSR